MPAGCWTIYSVESELRLPDSRDGDPLSDVITLLQPRAVFSRPISGAGRWGVRYSAFGEPSFCAVLQGACTLAVDGHRSMTLEAGDFVLLPATPGFSMSGFETTRFERLDPKVMSKVVGEVRHGTRPGPPDVRLLTAGSSSTRLMRAYSHPCFPRSSTCGVWNGSRPWCASWGRRPANRDQAVISCSVGSWRSC